MKDEKYMKDYCDTTLQMETGARTVYLLLAERLYNIREERLYQSGWDSWQEFCMEFKDMSPASVSKLIAVYDVFVKQYGFKPDELAKAGGWTKLYQMLKLIHTKQDATKWLALAENASRQDINKFLVEAKTGVNMSECKHTTTFLVRVCEDCGEKWREHAHDESGI